MASTETIEVGILSDGYRRFLDVVVSEYTGQHYRYLNRFFADFRETDGVEVNTGRWLLWDWSFRNPAFRRNYNRAGYVARADCFRGGTETQLLYRWTAVPWKRRWKVLTISSPRSRGDMANLNHYF
jgi:hypothetical protein